MTIISNELRKLRRLQKLLREVMEEGELLFFCDAKVSAELIKLAKARGVE